MPSGWDSLSLWFVTAAAGAFLIKLFDLAYDRFRQRQLRRESMVNELLGYLREFARLTEMYRFYATSSKRLAQDENGQHLKDSAGNFIVESTVLEPGADFEEDFKAWNNGVALIAAIEQQEIKIRAMQGDMLDLAWDLDPSGSLKEQFLHLYGTTAWNLKTILQSKQGANPQHVFEGMKQALDDAGVARRQVRTMVQNYLR